MYTSQIKEYQADVERLTKLQEFYKEINLCIRKAKGQDCTEAINAIVSKYGYNPAKLSRRGGDFALEIQKPDFAGRIGFASYVLTNNNNNIKHREERIKDLTQRQAHYEATQGSSQDDNSSHEAVKAKFDFESGHVLINHEAERVQIIFDHKPEYAMINELKHNGFKWSPTNSAWQRMITRATIYATNSILKIQIPYIQ